MANIDQPDSRLSYLVGKYFNNTCTQEDLSQLLAMVDNERYKDELTQVLKDTWDQSKTVKEDAEFELDKKFSILMEEAKSVTPVVHITHSTQKKIGKFRYAAAVIVVCLLSVGAYLMIKRQTMSPVAHTLPTSKNPNEIAPGGNKAVLTLADGSSILLDSTQHGILTIQGNSKILSSKGMLTYNSVKNKTAEFIYNTISTPRGGDYKIMLSDGTNVWLNAASSLKFPASFSGKERKVDLTGEAYFEVAKNAAAPFKVEVNGMEVEVLGTHFNINSYTDESDIRTTLLEGSIKINRNKGSSLLQPGQQARMTREGNLDIINHADVEEAVAWKEGKFQFNHADIQTVMRQIARWYNVEVVYNGMVSSHFGGTISRNANLSQVLNMLHLTGEVKFQVQDKKVTVMP